MSKLTAKLTLSDGREFDLNVQQGTLGYDAVDVQPLVKNKLFTFDPDLCQLHLAFPKSPI